MRGVSIYSAIVRFNLIVSVVLGIPKNEDFSYRETGDEQVEIALCQNIEKLRVIFHHLLSSYVLSFMSVSAWRNNQTI